MKRFKSVFALVCLATLSSFAETALQKHVGFFDQNKDGQIYVEETAAGFQALGLNFARAWFNAGIIHAALSNPFHAYVIRLDNIQKHKHGSDTGIYDINGQFDETKFTNLFDRFDIDKDGAISEEDLALIYEAKRTDFVGHVQSMGEFNLLMEIAGEDRVDVKGKAARVLTRETLRSFYEGTLFYEIEKKLKLNVHP